MEKKELGGELVFGLDIGTRNVVGTVGYKLEKEFIVLAQYSREHETRAMLDGQIHDIGRVGHTIRIVKEALEEQIGQTLTSVCIAAAGRVLKTVTTNMEHLYDTESVVTAEDVHTLELLGIEKAQSVLKEKNDTNYKFYCVGYSVVKHYLNDEIFSSLEGHKAEKIAEDIIVTFLPEDVIDGLYAAVALADLSVSNLTLEPIAAIDIAIPENYRMLNIALVDIGAGTSDISITKDGSIIAYGMIPLAGDEITELIAQNYLVDFQMAESMKLASTTEDEIEYTDIMQLHHTIPSTEIWDLIHDLVNDISTDIADKIMELNGNQSVKAVFIVGGGGKIHGFDAMLAEKLKLPYERVALRGEEVLQAVTFEQTEIKKDPLIVTPIGICLHYYEQKNSFILVHFNGERIKLYDNNKLTIVDAALQAGFPNESLFPRRGREIHFTVNGNARIARGEAGESAVVKVNDKPSNINAPLIANSYITVEPSTEGKAAEITIADIADYIEETVQFVVNGETVHCPKIVEVNGDIVSYAYEIEEGDVIETRNFYTVAQIAEYMKTEIEQGDRIMVNNRPADPDTPVYENFTVDWEQKSGYQRGELLFTEEDEESADVFLEPDEELSQDVGEDREERHAEAEIMQEESDPSEDLYETEEENLSEDMDEQESEELSEEMDTAKEESLQEDWNDWETEEQPKETHAKEDIALSEDLQAPEEEALPEITHITAEEEVSEDTDEEPGTEVWVNGSMVKLTGKANYIFVDIFDFIDFDLTASKGRLIVIKVNGEYAEYTRPLNNGDAIEIYWEEK